MKISDYKKNFAAEFIGTFFLLSVVVGSGIMGDRLSNGSTGMALLANSIATGAGLIVLIMMFGSISGAHFNPLVSFVEFFHKRISRRSLSIYLAAQFTGAVLGVIVTHVYFDEPWISLSLHERSGSTLMLSEFIASFGLISVIKFVSLNRKNDVAYAVGLYIAAAYWFTSSTSFANPAVTLARCLTATFTGIRPADVAGFIFAQILGALAAEGIYFYFFKEET